MEVAIFLREGEQLPEVITFLFPNSLLCHVHGLPVYIIE
jgi:hypothetical protein